LSFFNELKRRNVFRVTIAYIVVSWLVMQVADVILNNISAPGWVFQVILLLLGIGFALSVFFAWAFEMTPEGIKREHEVDRSQSITSHTGKKLNNLILAVMALALGYFAYDKFVLSAGRDAALVEATTQTVTEQAATEPEVFAKSIKSIAVLPFVNMSSDDEQEYFSDGLSEELLNLLAKIPELRVAARTSSFSLKGKDLQISEVGQILKVAYVLEGSVRKAGKQLRITAQLIKADDGFHLWSETYDRSLDNIFAIQDDISAAVVDALKIELLGETPKAAVVDPEAYSLVLKGRYFHAKWGKENFSKAIDAYQQALAIDPAYAEAWSYLASTYLSQTRSGYRAPDEGLALIRDAVGKALSLDPLLASAWAAQSQVQSVFDWDWAGSEASIQKALKLAPDNIRVLNTAGNLAGVMGNLDDSLAYYQRILDKEPLDLIALFNIGNILVKQLRLAEAEAAFRQLLELNPEDWGSHTMLATIMLMKDRPQEAWKELELEVDPQQQEWGRILVLPALQRDNEAVQRLDVYIRQNQSWATYLIAEIYAWRGDVDNAFVWLDNAYQQRDSQLAELLRDPLLASLHDDPRWKKLLDSMNFPH
jgi:adenylate cyclase